MAQKCWMLVCLTALTLQLTLTIDAEAQRGRGGFGRRTGGSLTDMLRNPAVREELEMLDEQVEQVRELESEMRDEMRKELQALQEKMQAKLRSKLGTVLMDHQMERLDQLRLQMQGTRALGNTEISKKLGITDKQIEQMEEIRNSLREKYQEAFRNRGEGGDFRQRMQELSQQAQEAQEEIRGLLTEEQRKKLQEMQGTKVDLQQFRQRGGPGRGRPGRPVRPQAEEDRPRT